MTPYGFGLATLISLRSARDAVIEWNAGFDNARTAGTPVTFKIVVTQSMKHSSSSFVCAKQAVQPFTDKAALGSLAPSQRIGIAKTANLLIAIYNKRIAINERSLQLVKALPDNRSTGYLIEHISTLQAESSQGWNDLVPTVGQSMLMLLDERATNKNGNFIKISDPDAGYIERLMITRTEKQALLTWFDLHFPEFKEGTSENEISEPAKDARMYQDFLSQEYMCSDEPATKAAPKASVENQKHKRD